MNKAILAIVVLLLTSLTNASSVKNEFVPGSQKLMVVIVVDQLRGDFYQRYHKNFRAGGFKKIIEEGTYFSDAQYQQFVTFTAVGHATLASGVNSSKHGVVSNNWYDPTLEKLVYCAGDPKAEILGLPSEEGRSSYNMVAPSIADLLVEKTGGKAIAISIKDRGAVFLGGKKGKSFWYTGKTSGFSSSSAYYKSYPSWVEKFNSVEREKDYLGKTWNLLLPKKEYVNLNSEAQNKKDKGVGISFPHKLPSSLKKMKKSFKYTAFADQTVFDFAKEALINEKLGQDSKADFLSLSLSANDYLGHMYGPYSLEVEDNLIRLDERINDFIKFLDQKVGRKNYTIAFSSDHGISNRLEKVKDNPGAVKLIASDFVKKINNRLQKKYRVEGDFIKFFEKPYIYLDHDLIKKHKFQYANVVKDVKEALVFIGKFKEAYSLEDLKKPMSSLGPTMKRAKNSYFQGRSGEIAVLPGKFWFYAEDHEDLSATHGHPYFDESHVPLSFFGSGVLKGGRVTRRVAPVDVAPTMAYLFGIKHDGFDGKNLIEGVK